MQYQIMMLCIRMIENEWHRNVESGGCSTTIEEHGNCYRGTSGYVDRLASTYYLLNILKAHYPANYGGCFRGY